MSSDTLIPPPITPEERAADIKLCRELLHEMMQVGMEHTRLTLKRDHARTEAETAALPPSAPNRAAETSISLDHERFTRAVRRSMMLLTERLGEASGVRAAAEQERQRVAGRKQIIREVEDEIDRDVPGPAGEALHRELFERLESPDCDDEIDTRPIAAVILVIRRDLGLATPAGCQPYFKRRTPADVAELCAGAVAPQGAADRRAQGGSRPTPIRPPAKPRPSMEELGSLCTDLLARDTRLRRP